MKKISLMIVAAGLLATSALTSCKKEEVKGSTTTTSKTSGSKMKMGGFEINTTNFPNADCSGAPVDCVLLGEVIINPISYALIGTAIEGGAPVVGTVFSSVELQPVCNAIGSDLAAFLQSGTYFIAKEYETQTTVKYIAGTISPVTNQNMDFAFQLGK